MINQTKWKEEERDMILKGETDEYIMSMTGRSVLAIQSKRYELTGHYRADYAIFCRTVKSIRKIFTKHSHFFLPRFYR